MRTEVVLTAALTLAAMFGHAGSAHAARAYIGTYTQEPTARGNNHGEGIYLVDIDDASGAVSNPRLVAQMKSPSWIALSPDHRFLYANSEILDYGGEKAGSVSAFAVDGASGALKPLNTVSSGAAGPAYIEIDRTGKFALVANYSGGSFAVIHIGADGSLGAMSDQVKPDGPLNPANAADTQPGQFAGSDHSGSHGHMIGMDPSGKYVIGDDAGRDQIFVWTLEGGKLHPVSVTKTLPGSAPRHFVFSPDGKTLYQLQEQDSRLQAYDFKDGAPTARGQSIFMPPDGYQGSNTTSELLINKAGTHLYAANRTQDSIATITAGKGGITRIANTHTGANNPRSLALHPNGKFLYSLNQGGHNVVTFRIGANGVPQPTGSVMALGSPAVMVFLKN